MYQKVSVTFSFAATKNYYSIRSARLQCSSGPFMLLLLEEERRGRNADGLPSAIEWRTIGCCDTTTTRLNGFDVAPCWFKSAPSNAFRRIFADFQVIRCFSTTQLISGSCSIVGLPVLVAWSNVPRYSFTIFCWKPLKPMGRCAVIIFASPVDKWEIRVTSVLCERPIWDFALASGQLCSCEAAVQVVAECWKNVIVTLRLVLSAPLSQRLSEESTGQQRPRKPPTSCTECHGWAVQRTVENIRLSTCLNWTSQFNRLVTKRTLLVEGPFAAFKASRLLMRKWRLVVLIFFLLIDRPRSCTDMPMAWSRQIRQCRATIVSYKMTMKPLIKLLRLAFFNGARCEWMEKKNQKYFVLQVKQNEMSRVDIYFGTFGGDR